MSYYANPTGLTTSVFGPAAAPVAWTNLDISAVTGAQAVLAIIKIEVTAGLNPRLAVRPDGDADEYFSGTGGAHGATRAFPTVANESVLLAVKTNNLGVIEWRSSVVATCEVFVLGWVNITSDSTNVVADSTFPTSWTEVDLGAIVGHRRVLAGLKFHRTGGSAETFACRPADDADDYLVTLPEVGGPNQDGNAATSVYSMMLTPTDENGAFDYQADAGPPAGVIDMACYAPLVEPTGTAEVFPSGAPPNVWTVLSLAGAGVPATSSSLVVLKVHRANLAGLRVVAFRNADDGGDYLQTFVAQAKGCACAELEANQTTIAVVPTNGNGDVDWIVDAAGINFDVTVLGWLPAPANPVVTNEAPEGNTVQDGHPTIRATITDEDGIDTTTIGLTATDARGRVTNIITAGTVQTGWTGTIVSTAPGDREITITVDSAATDGAELGNGELHTFSLSATSYGGGTL